MDPLQQQLRQQLNGVYVALANRVWFANLVAAPRTHGWKDRWGLAERRALKLFRDLYGTKGLLRYLRRGYVDVNAVDGRTYRVYRERNREIDVSQRTKKGKQKLYRLCVLDTENIPPTDGVMKRVWLLRCDVNSLHEQANVKSIY